METNFTNGDQNFTNGDQYFANGDLYFTDDDRYLPDGSQGILCCQPSKSCQKLMKNEWQHCFRL